MTSKTPNDIDRFFEDNPDTSAVSQRIVQIVLQYADGRLAEKYVDGDDASFHLELLCGSFVNAYAIGPSKFAFTNKERDLLVIEELRQLLNDYQSKALELSVSPGFALDRLEEPILLKCRAKTRGALDLSGVMLRHLKVVERLIKISGGTSRIDWRAAGVAGVAVQVWERLFRLETPNSIHADAPGPFGRFLTDILNELWWEFAPEKTPPSARSAMRAFKNVTNSGMQFRSNW